MPTRCPARTSSAPSDDLGQTNGAMAELAEAVANALIALDKPESVIETVSTPRAGCAAAVEPAPVQVASANPSEIELGNTGKVVSSIEITDECLVADICIDRYLWALYQRTPKEDTIKVPERSMSPSSGKARW